MSLSISAIRREYQQRALLEADLATDAIDQFSWWWNETQSAEIEEANAMSLATAGADGMPDARIVLLKGFDREGFVFFTNYESAKGRQLAENPRACLVFFWKELERQVRIHGMVEKVSDAESDEYFNSRPEGSRIGAWISPQSRPIESREWLEKNEKICSEKFRDQQITRPGYWGGYRVRPDAIEFWQGRPNRLHDRILYQLDPDGKWIRGRLAP